MKNHEFQELVDQNLSGLVWDERKRQKVHHAISEEEKPVKKISTTFVLIAAIVCLSVTALAAGLILSSNVDSSMLAEKAMKETYGIDSAMLGAYFVKSISENSDHTIIHYQGREDLSYVLGEYTVDINNGSAIVTWSHDGEDTSGGYDAQAWGLEQLTDMLEADRTHTNDAYYLRAKEIAEQHNSAFAFAMPSEDEIKAQEEQYNADEAASKAAAKLTEAEMIDLARQAVVSVYGLSENQVALMKCPQNIEEYRYYNMHNGIPVYSVWFYLTQNQSDASSYTEKDGIYIIDVNVETGMIESTVYDPGLGANE